MNLQSLLSSLPREHMKNNLPIKQVDLCTFDEVMDLITKNPNFRIEREEFDDPQNERLKKGIDRFALIAYDEGDEDLVNLLIYKGALIKIDEAHFQNICEKWKKIEVENPKHSRILKGIISSNGFLVERDLSSTPVVDKIINENKKVLVEHLKGSHFNFAQMAMDAVMKDDVNTLRSLHEAGVDLFPESRGEATPTSAAFNQRRTQCFAFLSSLKAKEEIKRLREAIKSKPLYKAP